MNLINKIFKKEEIQDENYLALTFTSSEIYASIWHFVGEDPKSIGFSEKKFKNLDSLIHEAASAIDHAGKLAQSDVTKVVFGLNSFWFEEGKISKETESILKNLSDDLDLDAQAFVPISSSINHYLKIKESVTPNALLIGAFNNFLEIHLARNNEISNTKIFKAEPTIEKIERLIEQIKTELQEDLPAKIIVYGPEEKSHLNSQIEKHKFKDVFLHEPKIQFLSPEDISEAVSFSQAADILGHDPIIHGAALMSHTLKDENEEKSKDLESKTQDDELGFVEGEDILVSDLSVAGEEPQKENDENEEKSPEEFAVEIKEGKEEQNVESPKDLLKEQESPSKDKKGLLEKLTTLSYFTFISKFLSTKSSSKNIALLVFSAFLIIGAFLFFGARFISKAEVDIKVKAKPQESNFQLTVIPGGQSNVEKSQLAGEEISESASGTQKAPTSGKKKVGEYAKGDIKVFNWTTSQVTFEKDTVVISKNGVKFNLSSEIQVASRSASTPGEKNVSVTAAEFGAGGNVAGGSEFTFQKYDELLYSAKNDNSFTGGDEKEVTVVSQTDQDKLKESLQKNLTEKAQEGLKNKLGDKKLEDNSQIIEVKKSIFDKKVDEEATLLTLDMEITAKAIIYSENDLKEYLAQDASKDLQDNFEARKENIEILSFTTKQSGKNLLLSGKYRANLTPKIIDEELKDKIKGKSEKGARSIIKEQSEVQDVTFNFSPNIFIINSLPQDKNKITIKIEAIK